LACFASGKVRCLAYQPWQRARLLFPTSTNFQAQTSQELLISKCFYLPASDYNTFIPLKAPIKVLEPVHCDVNPRMLFDPSRLLHCSLGHDLLAIEQISQDYGKR
jgi:hypothetical protein